MVLVSMFHWRLAPTPIKPSAPRPLTTLAGNTIALDFLPKRAAPNPHEYRCHKALPSSPPVRPSFKYGLSLDSAFQHDLPVPVRNKSAVSPPTATSETRLLSHNSRSEPALRSAANEMEALFTLTCDCRAMLGDAACNLATLYGAFQTLWMRSLSINVGDGNGNHQTNSAPKKNSLHRKVSPTDIDSDASHPLDHTALLQRKDELDHEMEDLKLMLNERMHREAIKMRQELSCGATPIARSPTSDTPSIADSIPSVYSKSSMPNKGDETPHTTSSIDDPLPVNSTPITVGVRRRSECSRSHRKRPPKITVLPRSRSIAVPMLTDHQTGTKVQPQHSRSRSEVVSPL